MNNSMICMTDQNGLIFMVNGFGQPQQQIGVTLQKYNEMKEQADRFYNKLVELGAIKKEKTAAEISAEIDKKFEYVIGRLKKLEGMYGERFGGQNIECGEDVAIGKPEQDN